MRLGKWKPSRTGLSAGKAKKAAKTSEELYDLENDPAETTNDICSRSIRGGRAGKPSRPASIKTARNSCFRLSTSGSIAAWWYLNNAGAAEGPIVGHDGDGPQKNRPDSRRGTPAEVGRVAALSPSWWGAALPEPVVEAKPKRKGGDSKLPVKPLQHQNVVRSPGGTERGMQRPERRWRAAAPLQFRQKKK